MSEQDVPSQEVNLRLLRYFITLGDELNYRRAAERLHISQPALSAAVKQLEKQLGSRLFDRTTHKVGLTDFGAAHLPHVKQAMNVLDTVLKDMQRDSRGRGRLRIGYLIGTGADHLFQILDAFQAKYPGIRVDATEFDFSDPTAGLASGASDVAVLRPPVPLEEHRMLILETETWLACLPRNHRFAERTSLEIEELLDEPIIAAPESASVWRDFWVAADARGGKPANVSGTAATYESETTLVAMGVGISFTTSSMTRLYSRPGIRFVPINNRPTSVTALVWNPRTVTAEARQLIGSVRVDQDIEEVCDLPTR